MTDDQGGVFLADARDLKQISSRFVRPPNAIITSPPYLDTQNYGVEGQIGFGQSDKQYIDDLFEIFRACNEVSDEGAILWIVVGAVRRNGKLIQLPEMMTQAATGAGWIAREQVTWAKGKSLPWSRSGEFRDITEQLILLSKTESYSFNLESLLSPDPSSVWWRRYPERYAPIGRRPTNLWTIPIPTQGSWKDGPRHFCPFPHELSFRMIALGTNPGDVVLDPFAGVGSVPAMAAAMNRIGYGLELSPDYVARFPMMQKRSLEWFEIKDRELSQAQRRHSIFKQTILRLRLLKFGRLIAESLISLGYPTQWIHVRSLRSTPTQPHKIIKGGFEVGLTRDRSQARILSKLDELAAHRPLSKFGIQPEFRISGPEISAAPKFWYKDAKFWLEPTTEKPEGPGPHLTADFRPRMNEIVELSGGDLAIDCGDGGFDPDFYDDSISDSK